ncbi:uncharacterized protein F5147DRAFT_657569 [Suillus discolor]|uniref:Uncharacterized protein n=1 Tax=Suillus discolor TaxID=1912936 RepID=A0A9P7JNN2_9AGAM|nr:uncharacterized protein F5147DRAFT_657569 [Suillus discolor]KAG2092960.1 hypothetical protein F5147DRAFT_657569 [Suillus discolor]
MYQGFEPTQTDLDSVILTAWLRAVEFNSNEPIQKQTWTSAGALNFKTCLPNNFLEKVLMADHHTGLKVVISKCKGQTQLDEVEFNVWAQRSTFICPLPDHLVYILFKLYMLRRPPAFLYQYGKFRPSHAQNK